MLTQEPMGRGVFRDVPFAILLLAYPFHQHGHPVQGDVCEAT